jgi:hypothetical protein
LHAPPNPQGPVEGDGVSYRGIVWFIVILTVTTLVCQGLMWALFAWQQSRHARNDAPRALLAAPADQMPPAPNLLYLGTPPNLGEPANLDRFRRTEDELLHGYGWVDRNAGTVRIPIDRAKDLLMERGLPVRGASPAAPEGGTPARGGGGPR